YPEAVAEDMEGYAVAMACYAANVTVSIVRGISNQAGNRDQSHWKTKEALVSVAQALSSCLRPPIPEPTSPE
ncbi:MAG: hypothetical protein KDA91_25270, partial [Planctomycetaceae bacterium]|nr:hypothetical protein [Planctomycetaceae bacterium]